MKRDPLRDELRNIRDRMRGAVDKCCKDVLCPCSACERLQGFADAISAALAADANREAIVALRGNSGCAKGIVEDKP